MTELGAPWDAVNTGPSDQNVAFMADLGRQWAAFYQSLLAGGVPERNARRMLERQHHFVCQHGLLVAAGQAGAR